ncbi:hypothetical protein [Aureibacter tunicatorum]|uniref:Lipoprotein n=1 Tax=Aureibacter tunicatorum TaxID=866807 RepID=A0AAE3XPH8_9BACT|nr:hypothetical protein [Aureibacter tunicatorum]MDR6240752.1 hypothetical protein [Aureibacter tunicatorum]
MANKYIILFLLSCFLFSCNQDDDNNNIDRKLKEFPSAKKLSTMLEDGVNALEKDISKLDDSSYIKKIVDSVLIDFGNKNISNFDDKIYQNNKIKARRIDDIAKEYNSSRKKDRTPHQRVDYLLSIGEAALKSKSYGAMYHYLQDINDYYFYGEFSSQQDFNRLASMRSQLQTAVNAYNKTHNTSRIKDHPDEEESLDQDWLDYGPCMMQLVCGVIHDADESKNELDDDYKAMVIAEALLKAKAGIAKCIDSK